MLTDNVPDTVSDQVHGCDRGLLGVPRHVGGDHGQKSHECGWAGLGHVVTNQTTRVVALGKSNDKDHSDHGGDKSAQTAENTLVGDVAHVAVQQQSDDFDCASRDTKD